MNLALSELRSARLKGGLATSPRSPSSCMLLPQANVQYQTGDLRALLNLELLVVHMIICEFGNRIQQKVKLPWE